MSISKLGDRSGSLTASSSLIGGSAQNQNDLVALDVAFAAWSNGDLAGTLDSLGKLIDDGDKDKLYGQQGTDALFGGVGDKQKQ